MHQHKQSKSHTKAGFTIIEISLATVILSFLLITISTVIINITSIYQKGITIKNLNSVGRNLVADVNSSIEAARPTEAIDWDSQKDGYYRFDNATSPTHGAVCFGGYSYLWHRPGVDRFLTYRLNGATETKKPYRLFKVKDPQRQVCIQYNTRGDTTNISKADGVDYDIATPPEELLADNEVGLYVYRFTLKKIRQGQNQPAINVSQTLFSGKIFLGTERGVDTATLSNCHVDDAEANFDYCAINTFKFAARTAGKASS